MDLQCVKSSSCLFIGFCFLRQEAGLELPMSEDDLELLSPLLPPSQCYNDRNWLLCSACPELLATFSFPCGYSPISRTLTLSLEIGIKLLSICVFKSQEDVGTRKEIMLLPLFLRCWFSKNNDNIGVRIAKFKTQG